MMAPLPPIGSTADIENHQLDVRLDVRMGTARATSLEFARNEILIGGADGCDLRLQGSQLPPVICQLTRNPQGVFFRRLVPAFPILLNGSPLSSSDVVSLQAGDRVAVGSADIVVQINGRGHLRPAFHPVTEVRASGKPTPKQVVDPFATLERERSELERLRQQVAEQSRELEADRVAWYRRRQEIEAEVKALGESATAGTKLVKPGCKNAKWRLRTANRN
jgi:predicted component of type VI protein secretion system